MKVKDLSKAQRRELEQIPASVLADFLPDLYYWESLGLTETISSLIVLVNDLIENDRRRKKGADCEC